MLYCDRKDVSEEINVNKKSESKECDIAYYWCFLDKWFTFQLDVCNGGHDALMMSMNLSDVAILNLNGADYQRNYQKLSHKFTAKCRFD